MASRRIVIDPSHPATMTPYQRRAELATLLVAGLVRLLRAGRTPALPFSQPCLRLFDFRTLCRSFLISPVLPREGTPSKS